MKKAAFAVRSRPTPRNSASDAIVSVPGVSTSSTGSSSSAAGWVTPTFAICWFAA